MKKIIALLGVLTITGIFMACGEPAGNTITRPHTKFDVTCVSSSNINTSYKQVSNVTLSDGGVIRFTVNDKRHALTVPCAVIEN